MDKMMMMQMMSNMNNQNLLAQQATQQNNNLSQQNNTQQNNLSQQNNTQQNNMAQQNMALIAANGRGGGGGNVTIINAQHEWKYHPKDFEGEFTSWFPPVCGLPAPCILCCWLNIISQGANDVRTDEGCCLIPCFMPLCDSNQYSRAGDSDTWIRKGSPDIYFQVQNPTTLRSEECGPRTYERRKQNVKELEGNQAANNSGVVVVSNSGGGVTVVN